MTESTPPIRQPNAARNRLNCAHAVWTRRQLLFALPQYAEPLLASEIYLTPDGRLLLHTKAGAEEIEAIRRALEEQKPASLAMTLALTPPEAAVRIPTDRSAADEAWCVDEPMTHAQLNQLFSLADPTTPEGILDWDGEHGFCFTSPEPLSDDEKEHIRSAAAAIGLVIDRYAHDPLGMVAPIGQIITRRQARRFPAALRTCLEHDEIIWRQHADGALAEEKDRSLLPATSACLIDGESQGDATLSELLCLYDVVNVILPKQPMAWFSGNHLDKSGLAELCSTGRVRLVLPHGLQQYPINLVAEVAEQAPKALVLSRELAVLTLKSNARKDPITYGSWPSEFKAAFRGAVYQHEPAIAPILVGPGHRVPIANLDFGLTMQGAMAMLGAGPGARLADVFESRGLAPPRLELMLASAGIEWALGLGAAWVPRVSEGYDETRAARSVASLWSRSTLRGGDYMANRMHTVVDELLAVSGIPPTEVARALTSADRTRFASVAKRLLAADVTPEELQGAVEDLNRQTREFERKTARIRRWHLDTLAVGIATKPLGDALDNSTWMYTSVIAAFIYQHLMERLPRGLRNEFENLTYALAGACLAPSIDPVIVGRTRDRLRLPGTAPNEVSR